MAEALLRELAQREGVALEVRSAGVSTVDGLPISSHAAETLRRRQIRHQASSRALTAEAVAWADLILTMTSGHKRHLLERYPQAVEKSHTLKEYVAREGEVLSDIEELERLYTDLHMKQALGEQLSEQERSRLLQLEAKIPSFDIGDPFGGTLAQYEMTADEIAEAIRMLLDKLR